MLCMVCKDSQKWSEYTVCNTIHVCHDCKNRFNSEILLVCDICDSMCFIPKTPKNIERLQYFIQSSLTHFIMSDTIIPMHGCPNCVSYKHNPMGEVRDEFKPRVKEDWR
jgi:hypothetical protein